MLSSGSEIRPPLTIDLEGANCYLNSVVAFHVDISILDRMSLGEDIEIGIIVSGESPRSTRNLTTLKIPSSETL